MRSEQSQESPSNNQDREHDDQSSQETNMDFVKSGEELIAVAKKRRETKRKSVRDDHVKRTKDITERMKLLFETRTVRVTKIQKAQWTRLDALNKRRSSLEAQILASMKSIEQHTANICSELSATLHGRREDVLESQAVLSQLN